MLGSVSRAWIIRPPQKVSAPVTRTRRLTMPQPNQTLRRSRSMSYTDSWSSERMRSDSSMIRLFEYRSWSAGDVEVHRREDPQLELGGKRRHHAERARARARWP